MPVETEYITNYCHNYAQNSLEVMRHTQELLAINLKSSRGVGDVIRVRRNESKAEISLQYITQSKIKQSNS